MKLFGTAFFSLAVFSLWSTTASAQESAGTTTTSTTTQAPSESSLTTNTASTSAGSTSVSSINESKASQTTTSSNQVLSTTNNSSSSAGTTHSLPPSSETAASKRTPTAIDSNTTITGNVTEYQIHPESTSQNTTQRPPDSTGSDSGNTEQVLDTSYTSILLPVIIALIVITLSVCLLGALYRICWKTTPERQENETEHTSLDKENVKLISVKTTSPESGEHSSQGKNKTRQHDESSSHLGNKCV